MDMKFEGAQLLEQHHPGPNPDLPLPLHVAQSDLSLAAHASPSDAMHGPSPSSLLDSYMSVHPRPRPRPLGLTRRAAAEEERHCLHHRATGPAGRRPVRRAACPARGPDQHSLREGRADHARRLIRVRARASRRAHTLRKR